MNTIVIDNLEFSWSIGASNLLTIPELKVAKGEHLFVHGSSGTGKSTLLNLISGVILPDSGTIELMGAQTSSINQRRRDKIRANHIGYIFQQFNLLPYLSVLQNVLMPLKFSKSRKLNAEKNHNSSEQAAIHWLNELNIPSKLHTAPIAKLSVGQQQRVAAARALIGSPDIIIADEPTSSLDQDNVENFMHTLIEESAIIDASIVFVSHDKTLKKYFDKDFELRVAK